MDDTESVTLTLVGYLVRESGSGTPVGQIEGVAEGCARVHRIPGYPGQLGYLPEQAIGAIDPDTSTIDLKPGIGIMDVINAPQPANPDTFGWHTSSEWWSDLLGHFGLSVPEGRGNEPILHPGQR